MAADEKLPVPFGRTKRWSLLGAIAIVALLLIHTCWANYAYRQLEKRIAAIHARGEPILVDDFNNRPSVPDEENAAIPLQKAFVLTFTAAQDKWRDNHDRPVALSETDKAMVRSIGQANAQVFADLHDARSRPRCNWGIKYKAPIINVLLPNLSQGRELACFLADEAMLRHADGDDQGAMELAGDMIFLGETIGDYSPCLICHLLDIGIQQMASNLIQQIVTSSDIPPKQARALIKRLLDEKQIERQAREMWHGERALGVDVLTSGSPLYGVSHTSNPVLRPMLQLDACRFVDSFNHELEAARQTSYSAAASKLVPKRAEIGLRFVTRYLSSMLRLSSGRAYLIHWRMRADRRMAAVVLAIRLYRMDHGGKFPGTLDELVPAYLPSVPADPFAREGRPFGYIRDKLKLYSVGENGIDDGGRDLPAKRQPWDRDDYVIDLLPPPSSLPATKPALESEAPVEPE